MNIWWRRIGQSMVVDNMNKGKPNKTNINKFQDFFEMFYARYWIRTSS